MRIDFASLPRTAIPNMNGGAGEISAKMHVGPNGKLIFCTIPPGASIGTHVHDTSDDINFVVTGQGKAVCDGISEALAPGVCHVCPIGSSHSIANTGKEDLLLFTVVVEKGQAVEAQAH